MAPRPPAPPRDDTTAGSSAPSAATWSEDDPLSSSDRQIPFPCLASPFYFSPPPFYSSTCLRKNIAILGSTGSIGCNALDVVEKLGAPYRALALSAHSQTQKLIDQVTRHKPAAVAITDESVDRKVVD